LISASYYRQRFLSLFVLQPKRYNREIYAICTGTNGAKAVGGPDPWSPELPHGQRGSAPFESPRSAQAVALNLIMPCEGEYRGKLIAEELPLFALARKRALFAFPSRGRCHRQVTDEVVIPL